MVEYRLAKARVAGSNPVSCSLLRISSMDILFLWKRVCDADEVWISN